jgi:putative ubiquitin-RnfH superfamily antitoxin RatB of RatAB toxin-antitoxin module
LQVEVIYAEPDRMLRCQIDVPVGSTVGDCVSIAAAQSQFSALDCTGFATGIFGEQCGVDRVVQLNDRIELYRPLITDAKTARRLRAQQQRAPGQ